MPLRPALTWPCIAAMCITALCLTVPFVTSVAHSSPSVATRTTHLLQLPHAPGTGPAPSSQRHQPLSQTAALGSVMTLATLGSVSAPASALDIPAAPLVTPHHWSAPRSVSQRPGMTAPDVRSLPALNHGPGHDASRWSWGRVAALLSIAPALISVLYFSRSTGSAPKSAWAGAWATGAGQAPFDPVGLGTVMAMTGKSGGTSKSKLEDEAGQSGPQPPKLYPQRWVQLAYLSVYALISDWVCFSVAAIPESWSEAYGHSASELVDLFLFTNVLTCFLFTDIARKFGLRKCIVAAASLMTAGCFLRSGVPFVGGLPPYSQVMAGTILVGAAQPFFQCTPPLLSAMWFGSEERALATATAINFNQVALEPHPFPSTHYPTHSPGPAAQNTHARRPTNDDKTDIPALPPTLHIFVITALAATTTNSARLHPAYSIPHPFIIPPPPTQHFPPSAIPSSHLPPSYHISLCRWALLQPLLWAGLLPRIQRVLASTSPSFRCSVSP